MSKIPQTPTGKTAAPSENPQHERSTELEIKPELTRKSLEKK